MKNSNNHVFAAPVIVALILIAEAAQADVVLENEFTRVRIDERGNMTELANKRTGWNWCGGGRLWRMYFDRRFTPKGTPTAKVVEEKEIPIDASVQQATVTRDGTQSVIVNYPSLVANGEALKFSLRLTVTLEEDGQVRFRSELRNDEPHTIVRELQYPLVTDCRLPKDAELLNTHLGGKRVKNPIRRIVRPGQSPDYMIEDHKFRQFEIWGSPLKYPSHTSANCYALLTGTEGLYVASHDPTFQDTIHIIRCWPGATGEFTIVETGLAKFPSVIAGGQWTNDTNVICPYSGNWTATARRYRAWANSWWKKRPVPAWVRKMTGWHRTIFRHQYGATYYSPADLNGRIASAGDAAGLDTMLCFGWWARGMDNGYPDSYFACDDSWASAADWKREIAAFRKSGHNFLLYFNGKLIDTESDYYKTGPGKRIALKTNTGETYVEQYRFAGTGIFTRLYNARSFASADHRHPEWQQFLRKAVDLAIDFGSSGVFFDQLGYCEPTTTWDCSGEFPIPQTRTIAAKAAALADLRDYIESKGLHDFALGTENFVDCCAQSVDYMHNLIGATGDENFTDWIRYAFPECIISDREIRDDFDIPWRVNHNLLVGLRSDVEIWRCRGLIDNAPVYQARLAEINRLRAKFPVLIEGRFLATDGLSNTSAEEMPANVFANGNELAVVACTRRNRPAKGTVTVRGWHPVTYDGIDQQKVTFDGDKVNLDLKPNALVVIRFEK